MDLDRYIDELDYLREEWEDMGASGCIHDFPACDRCRADHDRRHRILDQKFADAEKRRKKNVGR